MKARTHIIGTIIAVGLCGVAFVSFATIMYAISERHTADNTLIVSLAFCIILLPFWLGLLKERKWAWWSLVCFHLLCLPPSAWLIADLKARYASSPGVPPNADSLFAELATVALYFTGAPLLVLLTDRPSGWTNPQSEIRNPK